LFENKNLQPFFLMSGVSATSGLFDSKRNFNIRRSMFDVQSVHCSGQVEFHTKALLLNTDTSTLNLTNSLDLHPGGKGVIPKNFISINYKSAMSGSL